MTVVLLPPSETKKSSDSGPKLRLTSLAHPTLTAKREILTNQLQKVSAGPPKKAREILGLSAKQDFELERNQQLFSVGTARAWQIYTGVLYEALDPSSLTQTQLQKICDLTFVQSALFGLISLADAIPAYRLSADSVLPKIGSLAKFWGPECSAVVMERNELVIDLRSGSYEKLAPIPEGVPVLVPKILQRMPSGPPKVVSHHNKATKGRILRAIAKSNREINSVESLIEAIEQLGAHVDVKKSPKNRNRLLVEVVVSAL